MRGKSRAPSRGRASYVAGGFPWLALATLIGVLLPFDPASPLSQPASVGSPGDYARALPEHVYLLIKAALPWVPLGLLAHLGLSGRARAWLAPAVTALLLASLPWLRETNIADLLQALYAMPGVALGLWLGQHSLASHGEPAARARYDIPAVPVEAISSVIPSVIPSASPPRGDAAETAVPAAAIAATAEGDSARRHHAHRHGRRRHGKPTSAPKRSIPLMLLGGASLALALAGGFAFPIWPLALVSALLLYGALLWRYPLAWLVAVPAALPLLDLAPWSGRFFFDEFDLLMLTTAGVLFLKRPLRPLGGVSLLALALFLSLAVAALLGSLPGLSPPPPLDANAFSSYWSAYNSVRVAKGLFWGGLFFLLIRRGGGDLSRLGSLLAVGMGIGLLGVGGVGLWERWLFAGFANDAQAYRIFGTFSSMHTGGGHIEAYLVAALPFLWLGMARARHLVLSVPLLLLATAVLIFTVSRGGALALGVVLAILATGSLRLAARQGWARQAAPLGVLLLVAVALAAGVGGGYFQQRLAKVGEDWRIRVDHWNQALSMRDGSLAAQLFGMGLGSFPRLYLERGPSDRQSATYGFVVEQGNTFLRLGSGDTLYYAQRASATAGQTYRLSVDIRGRRNGRLAVPLCEKQMLDSRACVWTEFEVAGDGQWHRYTRELANVRVGAGGPLKHPPVELFLYHPGKDTLLDVDNLRLLDASGQDLLCNGDFANGGDCWFFKTHSHLPWHIKNLWVHVLFEQGWLGLILFSALTLLALARLARAAWRGARLAWVMLAALAGMLTVGLFDSLLDAPRLATLLWAFLLLGGGLPWPALARAGGTASE